MEMNKTLICFNQAYLAEEGKRKFCIYRNNPYGEKIVENNRIVPLNERVSVFYLVFVEFKYGVQEFYAKMHVKEGAAVVTDGDRGEDLGIVRRVVATRDQPPRQLKFVRRAATPEDMTRHQERLAKEKDILTVVRNIAEKVRCNGRILDVMCQLDGHKITIIIQRHYRPFVDFRCLQRAAFSVYRCRIWCEYIDEVAGQKVNDANILPQLPSQHISRNQIPTFSRTMLPKPSCLLR